MKKMRRNSSDIIERRSKMQKLNKKEKKKLNRQKKTKSIQKEKKSSYATLIIRQKITIKKIKKKTL